MMEEWIKAKGPVVKFRILTTQGVAVCDPVSLKRIFQTGQKLYNKDLDLSYKPFLPILGSGLVTADGDLWQKQRLLIGPALRTDILDEIVPIARNATQRLIKKLEHYRGTGQAIDIQKEFHLLTLQVIGEAVLSLAPEQCDRVSAGRMHAASLDCKPGSFLWNKTTPVHLSVLHFQHMTGVPTAVLAGDGGSQPACAQALAHVPAPAARVLEVQVTHDQAQHLPDHILQVSSILMASRTGHICAKAERDKGSIGPAGLHLCRGSVWDRGSKYTAAEVAAVTANAACRCWAGCIQMLGR
jgi:hypothetical protein